MYYVHIQAYIKHARLQYIIFFHDEYFNNINFEINMINSEIRIKVQCFDGQILLIKNSEGEIH